MVYDVLGREESVLVNEKRNAGVYEVRFDGLNRATGVYFYQLQVRSALRQAEDESLALHGSWRADPLDPASGRGSKSGAGGFVQTRKLLLLR